MIQISDLNPHALKLPDPVYNRLRILCPKIQILLEQFGTARKITSGYRDEALQAKINPAAKHSKHMTGDAADISDIDGELDAFCTAYADDLLAELGLYLEHPSRTPRWCHVQQIAPLSGHRIFIP